MYAYAATSEAPVVAPVATPWANITGRSLHVLELRSREALFSEGDDADFLYEIVEGVMCSYRILPDGRRLVMSFAYPGDLIGHAHSATYRFGCEAVCDARVRSIPRTALLRDVEGHADIGNRLLEIATAELVSTQEHQVLLGRKTALEKLASFLLVLARRSCGDNPQDERFQIPMTRADIADFLGLTIETVSRNMTKLRVMGVIDLPQTTTVLVRDLERLEDIAEEEFSTH